MQAEESGEVLERVDLSARLEILVLGVYQDRQHHAILLVGAAPLQREKAEGRRFMAGPIWVTRANCRQSAGPRANSLYGI